MAKLRPHLSYANVVATLALVIALGGGGAIAASGKLDGHRLKAKSVTKAKIAKGAITASKLAPGAVTRSALAPQAVGPLQLGAIEEVSKVFPGGTFVDCPPGTQAISGGGNAPGAALNSTEPFRQPNGQTGWRIGADANVQTTTYAFCLH